MSVGQREEVTAIIEEFLGVSRSEADHTAGAILSYLTTHDTCCKGREN